MPSWKAIASSSKVPQEVGSATLMKNVPPRLPSGRAGSRTPWRRWCVACTAHGACGSVANQLGIASHARAIASSEAVTSSSPLREVQRGVGAHRGEDLLQVVGADDLGPEGAVLLGQLLDLRQPDVVDLLRADLSVVV